MSNQNHFSLWSFVQEQRDKKNKDKIYDSLKFEPKTVPIERDETTSSRQFRTISNTNPVNFDGTIGDIEALLNHGDLEEKRLLNEEIQIQLSKDSEYFVKLITKYKDLKESMSFNEFMSNEIKILLEKGKIRKQEIFQGLNRIGRHYYDDKDIQNVPKDYRSYQFSQYQKVLYAEKVMSIFKGKESIFEDPFGMGLEPSLKVYHPNHFDHTIFNPNQDVRVESSKTQVDASQDNGFLDFVKNM